VPSIALRSLASAAASSTASEPTNNNDSKKNASEPTNNNDSKKNASDKDKKSKKDDSNVFLDNLGSFFLAGIGLLIASLIRSYLGSTNRNTAREILHEISALDPLEIDDLRIANSELTLSVYRALVQDLVETYSTDRTIRYVDFVKTVRSTMKRLKGDAFTIELGHLLDRVVLYALSEHGQTSDDPQPLSFWLTVLSLALHATVPERIRALYEALQAERGADNVTLADVRRMVGYLQDTCQLTPESQVITGARKYPVQQYERGLGGDLFEWDGAEDERLDIDAFADILRSRAVCVWGECHHKKKLVI